MVNLQLAIGQENFKLSIVKGSDSPNTEKAHFYLLELENNSNEVQTYSFKSETIACKNYEHKEHSEFDFEFFDSSKRKQQNTVTLNKNQKIRFYVKTMNTPNSKISSWNCSKVIALESETSKIQSVNILSFIQNPNSSH